MPDEPNNLANDASTFAVAGVVCVSATKSGQKAIEVGSAAGWMSPAGIAGWERELSFVARAEMTAELAKALHATLPHEQIAPARFPMAFKAVEASPLLGIARNLVEDARKRGARVHTVGVDRVSGGFFYFAEGGARDPVNAQGSLVDMLAPSLTATTTNAEIETLLEGALDRLLLVLSDGVVSELAVELADALPRLSRDGTGLEGTDIEAFDARARALAGQAARHAATAPALAEGIVEATRSGQSSVRVPLYGEARRESAAPLDVLLGGKALRLPARFRWLVTGPAREAAAIPEQPARAVALEKPAAVEQAARPEKVAVPPERVAAPERAATPEKARAAETPAAVEKPAAPEKAATAEKTAAVEKPAALPAALEKPAAPAKAATAEKAAAVERPAAPEKTEKPEKPRAEPTPPAVVAAEGDRKPKTPAQESPRPRVPSAADAPSPRPPAEVGPRSLHAPRGPRSTKNSPVVMMFLLLAFAATLYLSLRTAFSPQ
jgi:hypothetical protein